MSNDLTDTEPPRRSWVTGKRLIGIAITVLIMLRVGVDLMPIRVQIGPETTYIDGPLKEDGTPDYAAYLNEQWSKGVTPDQNAAVDLIHAFGPSIINEDIREEYFQQLGIELPPFEGDYYIDFLTYMEQNGSDWRTNPSEMDRLEVMRSEAMTRPWSADEFPEFSKWVQRNEEPMAAILAASDQPRYYSPLVSPEDAGLLFVTLELTQKTRDATRILLMKTMLAIQNGDISRAVDLSLAGHRLSRLVSEHPTLIGQLVAYAESAIASVGDEQIILSGQLSAQQAIEYRSRLSELPEFQPMKEVIDLGERLMSLDAMVMFHQGRISGEDIGRKVALQWAFDPNPSMFVFNGMLDEINVAMDESDSKERLRKLEAIERRYDVRPELWNLKMLIGLLFSTRIAVSEQVGKMMVSLTAPSVVRVVGSELRCEIRQELVDMGYALADYRAETGSFPKSLESLVPEQLDELPIDPYSGGVYRYKLTDGGFLIWSVGPDGFDDGGRDHDGADDIAFGDRPREEE
ncbi:MAG: hypothetical protein KDA93_25045 [Planctomycetaceae bacterium]|nr:hypothetical protein [Planctomycetaceae bacterium]